MTPQASADPSNQPTYVEEPAYYYFTAQLAANQPLQQVAVNIDRDSDFSLTGIHGDSTGAFTLNFRLPSGRMVSNAQILDTDILGTPNQPTPVGPCPIYRAGSVGPALDLTDTSGATNNIRIVFSGIRRLRTT